MNIKRTKFFATLLGAVAIPASALTLVVGNQVLQGVDVSEVTVNGNQVTLRLASGSQNLQVAGAVTPPDDNVDDTPTTPDPGPGSAPDTSSCSSASVKCAYDIPSTGLVRDSIQISKNQIVSSKITFDNGLQGVLIDHLQLKQPVDVWLSNSPGEAVNTYGGNDPYQLAFCNRLGRNAYPTVSIRISTIAGTTGACIVEQGTYYLNVRLSATATQNVGTVSRSGARTQ